MSDDPTTKLPGDASRYDTQPTITTVLEKLIELGNGLRAEMRTLGTDLRAEMQTLSNGLRAEMATLGSDLRAEMQTLRVGQERLDGEVQSLRSEMNEQFAKVATQFKVLDKKMGILTREVMDVRAEHEIYDDRLEKLEEKTR